MPENQNQNMEWSCSLHLKILNADRDDITIRPTLIYSNGKKQILRDCTVSEGDDITIKDFFKVQF